MRRFGYIGTITLALTGGCSAQPEGQQVALMDMIEARMKLPGGVDPTARMETYARYYYSLNPGVYEGGPISIDIGGGAGGEKIIGVYIHQSVGAGRKPGRRWVSPAEAPTITDGGCSVITVIFDVSTEQVEDVMCNGLA